MDKYIELCRFIESLGSAALGFSGGVDSTLLARAAYDALGENAVAITVDTPYFPRSELAEAKRIAEIIGIKQVTVNEKIIAEIENNPSKRCYFCKKNLFSRIIAEAEKQGVKYVLDGSNTDDLTDYRPGLKALEELKIISPLRECGFSKSDVRKVSKELGLETHDKPAYACLLTRIPYDEKLTVEKIARIEKAEEVLHDMGFLAVRVRSHGSLARIEADRGIRSTLLDEKVLDELNYKLKEIGYEYVTVDAYGYQTGSFNKEIEQ